MIKEYISYADQDWMCDLVKEYACCVGFRMNERFSPAKVLQFIELDLPSVDAICPKYNRNGRNGE